MGRSSPLNLLLHAQHLGQAAGGFALRQVEKESGERDDIAATVARCKIAPFAGDEVHREGAQRPIGAGRVPRDVLAPAVLAVCQPAMKNARQDGQRNSVDPVKVETSKPGIGLLTAPTLERGLWQAGGSTG